MTDRAPSDELPTDEIEWIGAPHGPEDAARLRRHRPRGPASRLRRVFFTYVAGPLIGAVTVGVLAWLVSSTKGVFAMPARVERLEKRAVTDSARTDSLFRINSGVLSVLCFGLSDKAFEAANQICGEAFHISRIVAGEQIQREQKR